MARDRETRPDGIEERVVKIRRCAAVVKGGRRFSFNALVVVGDQHGRVAWGYNSSAICRTLAATSSVGHWALTLVIRYTRPLAVAGSYRLEICTGKDSWTRFSSRPDRTAMSVSTFQSNSALSYKGRRCNEFVKSALRAKLPLLNINCKLPSYLGLITNRVCEPR